MSWLMEHRMSAAQWCIRFEQEERLEFISTFTDWSASELDELIREANHQGRIQMQSFLMDYRNQHCRREKKTFDL